MTTGDSYRIVMPNSRVTVRVSTLWWQYLDPRDERSKIEPAIKENLAYVNNRKGEDNNRKGEDPVLATLLSNAH